MRRKRELIAAGIEHLDPLNCGSTIGFTIKKGRNLWAEVELTDCNRKIQWSFDIDDSGDGVGKIDKAIDVLSKFRLLWQKALRERTRARRKRTK